MEYGYSPLSHCNINTFPIPWDWSRGDSPMIVALDCLAFRPPPKDQKFFLKLLPTARSESFSSTFSPATFTIHKASKFSILQKVLVIVYMYKWNSIFILLVSLLIAYLEVRVLKYLSLNLFYLYSCHQRLPKFSAFMI